MASCAGHRASDVQIGLDFASSWMRRPTGEISGLDDERQCFGWFTSRTQKANSGVSTERIACLMPGGL